MGILVESLWDLVICLVTILKVRTTEHVFVEELRKLKLTTFCFLFQTRITVISKTS